MKQTRMRKVGAVITAAALTGLMGIGSDSALAAPTAVTSGGTQLNVAITDHGLYINGPTTFAAGRVRATLDNGRTKKDATFEVVRFALGYSFHDFRADLRIAFTNLFGPNGSKKKGLRHLNHAINHTTFYGGFDSPNGELRHGTLLLPDTGSYVLYDDSGNLPRRGHTLTVTGPAGPQTPGAHTATVTAKTDRRFGGDTNLPAHGNIEFINHSTESPHFLVLQQVKKGTTRKQVRDALQSNNGSIFLAGTASGDVVGHNEAMTLHLRLPRGTYAEMCFFPDPKVGIPHAFMGMIRIVHLS
jgi:hypothetical protein